jgi:hypothetical protein
MGKFGLAVLCAALVASCASGADLPKGEGAIGAFHQRLEAAQFADIYAKSTPGMKAAVSAHEFSRFLAAIHRKLDHLQSGKTVGWRENYNTSGHVLVMTYAAQYVRGTAQETFQFRFAEDIAVLNGYNVNSSPALVLN